MSAHDSSDSAEVMETLWLTKDLPAFLLGFLVLGLHTDLLMFCSECGGRAKYVAGVGLQTDVRLVGGLVLAGEEMYNRVRKHGFHGGVYFHGGRYQISY